MIRYWVRRPFAIVAAVGIGAVAIVSYAIEGSHVNLAGHPTTAQQSSTGHGPAPGSSPPAPQPETWPSGILAQFGSPTNGSDPDYRWVNAWQDLLTGEHVTVYAGGRNSDPSAGIIWVRWTSLDLSSTPFNQYGIGGRGALKIVSAAPGGILVLIAEDLHQVTFNASTGQQVS
jgi:hypothetical protein